MYWKIYMCWVQKTRKKSPIDKIKCSAPRVVFVSFVFMAHEAYSGRNGKETRKYPQYQ